MPSRGNKNSLVQPSKRADISPSSIKTVRTPETIGVATSQSTNSLGLSEQRGIQWRIKSPRRNLTGICPSPTGGGRLDDERTPKEKAAAELRAIKRKEWDPDASTNDNNLSFISRAGSIVSSTPSLERSIMKKKVQSDSPDSRDSHLQYETTNSNQQVVCRKGQPTAHLRRYS